MVAGSLFEIMSKKLPYSWEFGREWVLSVSNVNLYQPSSLPGPTNFDAVLGNPALAKNPVFFDHPRGRMILSDTLVR